MKTRANNAASPRNGAKPRRQLDRRAFLRLAGTGTAAGALGLPALLAACGAQSSKTTSGVAQRAGLKLPTYVAAKGPAPDFPGNAQGLEPGYATFPKDLYKSVTETPSKGGDITGLVQVAVLPNPVEKNPAWQQLNKQLGANLKLLMVPQADYASKWATITAGNDLPDLMYLPQVPALPNISAFTKSACADLTPYVSADAVKDYPNLANFAPTTWRVAIRNNAIYGVPIVRYLVGPLMYVQQNLLDAISAPAPKSADDFKRICKDLSNPKANKWAIGHTNDSTAGPYSMLFFQGMFNAPNNWRVDQSGKLVKDIETDEYKQALSYSRELVAAGYVSPDVKPNAGLNDDFFSGKIAMRANAWGNYSVAYAAASQKLKVNIRAVLPFSANGGKPGFLLGVGNFGFCAVKKAGADRVKEMLRVLNYLAAPFGSEEYMAARYGVKGVDYTFDPKGNPAVTDQGNADIAVHSWDYLAAPPTVAFSAYQPDFGRYGHEEEMQFLAAGISDPSSGRYSPTDEDKGAQLGQLIFDRVTAIAAGRAPLSDLDQLVKDWRSQGGDQIRSEFEQSPQIS